jgi:hypothetical protein
VGLLALVSLKAKALQIKQKIKLDALDPNGGYKTPQLKFKIGLLN